MTERLGQLTKAGELSEQEKKKAMSVARKIWIEAMRKIEGKKGSFAFQLVYDTAVNSPMMVDEVTIHNGFWNRDKDSAFNRELGGAPVDLVIDFRRHEYDPRISATEKLTVNNTYWFSARKVEKERRKTIPTIPIDNAEKFHPDKLDLERLLKIILSITPKTPVTTKLSK